MRPNKIKWENYLPIDGARTKILAVIALGFLGFIGLSLVITAVDKFDRASDLSTMEVVILAALTSFVLSWIVARDTAVTDMVANGGGIRTWLVEYKRRNIVGYDAVYRLLRDGTIGCEVVAGETPWSSESYPDCLSTSWVVRIPLNNWRKAWIGGYLPSAVVGSWQVALTTQALGQSPIFWEPEALWVRLSDASGDGLEMLLPHAMAVIKKYIVERRIRSTRDLLNSLLCDLASLERRERTLQESNKTLQRQREELDQQLYNAHIAMERAMFTLASNSRISNSQKAQEVRIELATTLHDQVDDERAKEHFRVYMKPGRPSRVKTT